MGLQPSPEAAETFTGPGRPVGAGLPASNVGDPQAGLAASDTSGNRLLIGAMCVIVAVGIALRFAPLSTSIWFDEAQTVRDVSGSLSHVLHTVVHEEANPPAYFLVLWFWRRVFGASIVAMRLLSALSGTAMIPLAFVVIRKRFGRRTALAAAALVAASPTLIYYSTELRMYGLLMLECGAGLAFFLSASTSQSRRATWLWAACSVLSLWTHYWAILVVAPQAVMLLKRFVPVRRRRQDAVLAVASVTFSSLPLLGLMLYQNARAFAYGNTLVSMPWQHLSPSFFRSFTHSFNLTELDIAKQLLANIGGPGATTVTLLVLAFVGCALLLLTRDSASARRRLTIRCLLFMAPSLALADLMIHVGFPVQGRYLLVFWLPAAAVVGYAVTSRSAGTAGSAILLGLCGIWLTVAIAGNVVPQLASRDDTLGAARGLGVASVTRLIAVDQSWDLFPLSIYRPAAHLDGREVARVKEIDIIRMPVGGEPGPAYHAGADLVAVPRLPSAFRLVSVERGTTFDVERFVANRLTMIRLAGGGARFSAWWRFLIEPAGGRMATL